MPRPRSIRRRELLVGLALALLAACSGAVDGGGLKWQKDPKKAFEFAHFTGKPMLVYFTSVG
jgi:hypothetical protein